MDDRWYRNSSNNVLRAVVELLTKLCYVHSTLKFNVGSKRKSKHLVNTMTEKWETFVPVQVKAQVAEKE